MNDKRPDSIVVENSIENIGKKNWNNCANHEALSYNPFVSYEFLNALEKSNSVNGDSGWYTSFFVAKDKDDKIIGCTPAYLKNNSSGEYVFDYSWAEAYQRVGRSCAHGLSCQALDGSLYKPPPKTTSEQTIGGARPAKAGAAQGGGSVPTQGA